jgi:hypothetical protein
MLAMLENNAMWALVGAAVLGPTLAVLLAVRDRARVVSRLTNLEDVLRRIRGSDSSAAFGDRPDESSLQLSR